MRAQGSALLGLEAAGSLGTCRHRTRFLPPSPVSWSGYLKRALPGSQQLLVLAMSKITFVREFAKPQRLAGRWGVAGVGMSFSGEAFGLQKAKQKFDSP